MRNPFKAQAPDDEARGVALWDSGSGFSFNGVQYAGSGGMLGLSPSQNALAASRPTVSGDLASIVNAAQPNSVVTAAVFTRALVLSQLWFEYENWQTGARFRHRDLSIFEEPGGFTTMPRLLVDMEVSQSYAGNTYVWKDSKRGRLRVLRPDYVSIVLGSDAPPERLEDAERAPAGDRREALDYALDAEVVAYVYQPSPLVAPQVIPASEVAHWVSEGHALSPWLGSSWITSCVREIVAEEQADVYADKFFQQGATPRLVYKMDPRLNKDQAAAFKQLNEEQSAGLYNSHRTLYVGGATDVQVVGSKLGDLALERFRAMLENRLASRSRVPPQILQTAAGNSGSSLNSGNYDSARKQFADLFFEPYADGLAAALQKIAPGPKRASRLSWDRRRVLLLQQDLLDGAEVLAKNMSAIRTGIDTGFEPDAMVTAVTTANLGSLVGKHSGKFSVQLLPEDANSVDANGDPVKGGGVNKKEEDDSSPDSGDVDSETEMGDE